MDFVASVSHELRTPLAVISAAAQNIADGVVDEKDQLAKYGGVIRSHTRQLNELVNQILSFASTKAGRAHYFLRPLQVSRLIDTVLHNTREVVKEAGFVVEALVEPDLPEIVGDLSALSQCLQNLIGNAVKYGGNHPASACVLFCIRPTTQRSRKSGSASRTTASASTPPTCPTSSNRSTAARSWPRPRFTAPV
jgi:signal transduction histidine kinase